MSFLPHMITLHQSILLEAHHLRRLNPFPTQSDVPVCQQWYLALHYQMT